MTVDHVLPVKLHFAGGVVVAGGVTREGGGKWRMVAAGYPSHVAVGTNLVKVREQLERQLAPFVAQREARQAQAMRSRTAPPRRRSAAVRMADAVAEARSLFGIQP